MAEQETWFDRSTDPFAWVKARSVNFTILLSIIRERLANNTISIMNLDREHWELVLRSYVHADPDPIGTEQLDFQDWCQRVKRVFWKWAVGRYRAIDAPPRSCASIPTGTSSYADRLQSIGFGSRHNELERRDEVAT